MISASMTELDQAWADRLDANTAFATAIGLDAEGDVRLYEGWPVKLLEKPLIEDVPQVTFFRVLRRVLGLAPGAVLIQSDIWAWRTQKGLLVDADNAMLAALTDGSDGAVSWFDVARQAYVSCRLVESSDPPEAKLTRRRHLWEIAPA